MQLTRYTDYGLRVLIFLALQKPGARSNVSDIASHFEIPRNHLVKIVHRLGQLGYVRTIRGKGGGIELALEPNQVRLGDVVRDLEATLEIVDCNSPAPCPILPRCLLRGALAKAQKAFFAVLDEYSLAELIRQPKQLRASLKMPGTLLG